MIKLLWNKVAYLMFAFGKSMRAEIYGKCCMFEQCIYKCVANGECVKDMRCGVVRYFACTSYLHYLVLDCPVDCHSVALILKTKFNHCLSYMYYSVSIISIKCRKLNSSLSYYFSDKYLQTNINIRLIIFILKVNNNIFKIQRDDLVTHDRIAPTCGARTIHVVFLNYFYESVSTYPLRSLIITDLSKFIDIYCIIKMNQPNPNNIIIVHHIILFLMMSFQLSIITCRQSTRELQNVLIQLIMVRCSLYIIYKIFIYVFGRIYLQKCSPLT